MKIQLKRSNVLENGSAKPPSPSQLAYGELAVNYASTDPTIFMKDSNDNVVSITANIEQYWTQGTGTLYPTTISSDVLIGGINSDAATIALSSNGSAEFAGEIGVGPNFTNSNVNENGTWISDTGRITFNHSTSQSNPFIRGAKNNGSGGNTEQFAINDDGSAEFTGNVEVKTADNQYCKIEPAGVIKLQDDGQLAAANSDAIRVSDNNGQVINLKYDGSATFEGRITGARLDLPGGENGTLMSGYSDSTKATEVFTVTTTGDVYAGVTSSSDAAIQLNSTGRIVGEGDSAYLNINRTNITPGSGALLLAYTDGVQKFKVGTDGSTEQSTTGDDGYIHNEYHADRNVAQAAIATFEGWWDGNKVSQIALATGDDTDSTSDGILQFFASPDGGTITETARFYAGGKANFGATSFYTSDTDFQITSSNSVKFTLSSPGNRTYSMFVVGDGSFGIGDESSNINRLTITDDGEINFNGVLYAPSYNLDDLDALPA